MKRHGNGLRSIGVLCCLLLVLPLVSLSAESNLYQELTGWSQSFELKLKDSEKRWDNLEQITLGLQDSMNTISLSYSELKKNSDERGILLTRQGERLQEVETILVPLQKTSEDLTRSYASIERSLKRYKVTTNVLIGTTAVSVLLLVLGFIM